MPDALDTDKLRELEAMLAEIEPMVTYARKTRAQNVCNWEVAQTMTLRSGETATSGMPGVFRTTETLARWFSELHNAAPALLDLAARAERYERALRTVRGEIKVHPGCCGFDYCRHVQTFGTYECDASTAFIIDAALPAADRRAENDKHE